MKHTLSQAEIDALLVAAGRTGESASRTAAHTGLHASKYNFRRPDRISKEQLRSLALSRLRTLLRESLGLEPLES